MSGAILARLATARAAGRAAAFDPAALPGDVGAAYAAVLAATPPAAVAAWKIGGANPWSQAVFGNHELFFGPLLRGEVRGARDTSDRGPYPLAGLVAPLAEPEILLELGPWPGRADTPLFSRMALGFEIPASVLPAAARPVLAGQVLDRAGAGGLWIGAAEPFDGARLAADFPVRLRVGGGPAREGRSASVIAGPVGSALLFLGQALRRGAVLRQGQWIATGGLVPAVPIAAGDQLEAEAAGMRVAMDCA